MRAAFRMIGGVGLGLAALAAAGGARAQLPGTPQIPQIHVPGIGNPPPLAPAPAPSPLEGLWSSGGQFQGSVDRRGNIYTLDGRFVGQIDRGSRPRADFERFWGNDAGFVSPREMPQPPPGPRQRSEVWGPNNERLGEVDSRGQFWDQSGSYRGRLPDPPGERPRRSLRER